MKQHILTALRLTAICIVIFCVAYPALIWAVAQAAPGQGKGETILKNGKVIGYEKIGQSFTEDRYFNSRPSAVSYNAAGSGGSNKGASNPDYLKEVQARIDTFLVHNPDVKIEQIPVELITASGSGLDPHLSPKGAKIQIGRIAKIRNIRIEKLVQLVDQHTDKPIMGPDVVHILKLNLALDELK
ncbi:K(+)-transporting ATPase subunit C [Daejeonella oryzae]|uniref:K(+)-transporting ATPase subunit C n=1 Tax=Daejeonella oryzae TaxID=1122943 RepID=UPI00040A5F1D|nr:K(+)-transporting ATPase subunit C [Daejeonella oryzae]